MFECMLSTVSAMSFFLLPQIPSDGPPLLRIYEGCGRAFLGEVEGANLIKLHRFSGKISYLVYPDFESDPHSPGCWRISL